jgi:hypothetical protein
VSWRNGHRKKGWKTVTQLITPHHFGDLLLSLNDVTDPDEYARRLHNNKQIIQRAFRNDTPNYLKQAEALSYAIRAAIDNELEQNNCMHYRAAKVNKECIEATNAVFTGKPLPVIRREPGSYRRTGAAGRRKGSRHAQPQRGIKIRRQLCVLLRN